MITHEEVFKSLQNCFENDEHQRNMLHQWNNCTVNGFTRRNTEKTLAKNLKLMIEELSQLQYSLGNMY